MGKLHYGLIFISSLSPAWVWVGNSLKSQKQCFLLENVVWREAFNFIPAFVSLTVFSCGRGGLLSSEVIACLLSWKKAKPLLIFCFPESDR